MAELDMPPRLLETMAPSGTCFTTHSGLAARVRGWLNCMVTVYMALSGVLRMILMRAPCEMRRGPA